MNENKNMYTGIFNGYSDDNISLDFYNKYYEFVYLLRQKNASSSKLSELYPLLQYVNSKYDSLNDDEKKLTRNIISISDSIIGSCKTYSKNIEEKMKICQSLIDELRKKEKQKEPIK